MEIKLSEVKRLAQAGKTKKEIAAELGVSVSTLQNAFKHPELQNLAVKGKRVTFVDDISDLKAAPVETVKQPDGTESKWD